MCVIVCKNAGVKIPELETLKNCWNNNSDGAGVSYWDNKKQRAIIEKGFMTWNNFKDYIEKIHNSIDSFNTAIIYHFRITSRGETIAHQCHPYPLSEKENDLKSLSIVSRMAIAHNGTMPITVNKGMNDTQTFIQKYLTNIAKLDKTFYKNPHAMQLIDSIAGSKFAFLVDNNIYMLGTFYKHNDIFYSNTSYEHRDLYSYDYKYYYSNVYFTLSNRHLIELLNKEIEIAKKAILQNEHYSPDTDLIEEIETRIALTKNKNVQLEKIYNKYRLTAGI